jgi:hypothetical protein
MVPGFQITCPKQSRQLEVVEHVKQMMVTAGSVHLLAVRPHIIFFYNFLQLTSHNMVKEQSMI